MKSEYIDVAIVGAGLSGLCVAEFLKKLSPELQVRLFEKSPRSGGAVQSMRDEGFLAEWGPHGFLDNTPESRELLADLDLADEMQEAPLKRFIRYLCLKGKLIPVPQRPPDIIKSQIMPFHGKLRALADLWTAPSAEEQTVAEWVSRRFGKAVLPLADAVFTGTYAGDIEKLSIDAVMPGIRRLEQETGSVFKAMLKMKKQNEGRGLPSMISFKKGMEQIIETLSKEKNIYLNSPILELAKDQSGWKIYTGKKWVQAKQLVLALQVNQSLSLLHSINSPPVPSIPEARIINVVMGFGESAAIPFGFGYLAPDKEQRFALGALFSTHMFPGRAPEKTVLLEALVGGRRHPQKLDLEDNELVERTYEDLRQLIKLPEAPCFTKILRPNYGIPQLERGHLKLQKWRNTLELEHPGLHICGFGWEGIGMNDVIKAAKAVAQAVSKEQVRSTELAKAKGVYF
ncbi:MAG: protoporphyrinogen oxidase [SAR324 cluster bacterium]|nr:protoporphyrinogen oxidase [SAR324 cluster bacterium]